jgi:DNA-binding CsgD family transcriptional regulator
MLAAGLANKEIASCLNISDHTAKFHVASILGKLGAATRTEAVALGIRRGLVLL